MSLAQAIAWLDHQSQRTMFDFEVYDRDVQPVLSEALGLLRRAARQPMTRELNDQVNAFLDRTDRKCRDCGARNPYLTSDGVCRHRRACEARRMLRSGAPAEDAARHAQHPGGAFWW